MIHNPPPPEFHFKIYFSTAGPAALQFSFGIFIFIFLFLLFWLEIMKDEIMNLTSKISLSKNYNKILEILQKKLVILRFRECKYSIVIPESTS